MRLRRSRLTDEQTERLLEHFVSGTPARAAAGLAGVNRNTARLFYHRLREFIARKLDRENPLHGDVLPVPDPPAERRRGARQTAAGTPVFGLIVRDGWVYTVPVRPDPFVPAPAAGTQLDAIVYSDSHVDRGALDVSGLRPRRPGDARRSARGQPRIDSVESFWSQAKRHLRRYNGVPRRHLHLFLKECEWRFNYGTPPQLLKVLKEWISTSSG
jgi:transposase